MKSLLISFAIFLCFFGCSNKRSDAKYSKFEISDRLIEQYNSSEKGVGFSHNLILKNFNPDLYTENNLIAFADRYIDTVSTGNPYFQLLFVSPSSEKGIMIQEILGP